MNLSEKTLQKAREFLSRKNYDALLVTSRENNRYLSGFTGSDSTLLIPADGNDKFLFTDSRYTEQAGHECPGFKIVEYKKVTETVGKKIKDLGLGKIAFESRHMSYNLYHRYVETLNSAVLLPQEKAIDMLRASKYPEEVELIEGAVKIAEEALKKALPDLKPGVRETDFALKLEQEIRRGGSGPIPFEIIVASGVRGAMPHGVASDKLIKKNELVTIDYGANYKGYMCDTTVTVAVGAPSQDLKDIYQAVKDVHDAAIEAIKPGKQLPEIDSVARRFIEKKGFGKYFGHGLGHGVGLAVHEEPTLSPLADGELPEGAVVTIEPGIYIPGMGGVRIEDMVLVTDSGARLLTRFPKNLLVLQ